MGYFFYGFFVTFAFEWAGYGIFDALGTNPWAGYWGGMAIGAIIALTTVSRVAKKYNW